MLPQEALGEPWWGVPRKAIPAVLVKTEYRCERAVVVASEACRRAVLQTRPPRLWAMKMMGCFQFAFIVSMKRFSQPEGGLRRRKLAKYIRLPCVSHPSRQRHHCKVSEHDDPAYSSRRPQMVSS